MTNTPFSKQVDFVAEFFMDYGSDYPELLGTYDLGFPLAVAVWQGGVDIDSLTLKGQAWITETFYAMCEELGVDKYNDWESLDEMIEYAEGE